MEKELLTPQEHLSSPSFFSGICVVHALKLHVFMFLASYCDVHLFCRGFTLYVCYLYLLLILVSIEEDMQLDNMNNISDGVRVS